MKKIICISVLLTLAVNTSSFPQDIQYLGLSDYSFSSMMIGTGMIAAGTYYDGVYWQFLSYLPDSGWNKIQLDSVKVTAVYPHQSGHLGWSIGIGAEKTTGNSNLLFCSPFGDTVKTLDYGIDTNLTSFISGLDGFPDPSICGETFAAGGRKLYRRFLNDSIWHSVYELTIEGSFASLNVKDEFEDIYGGGYEGFAGWLLIRSSDKGDTWENLSPLIAVRDVDFWEDTVHTIFVTDMRQVKLSTDDGSTWTTVFISDTLIIQKISFNKDGNVLFMIANKRVYISPETYLLYTTDRGNSWASVQIPINDNITGMDLDEEDNIYLATISSGIYKIKSPISKTDDDPGSLKFNYHLSNNFPNPFNSSTVIKYVMEKEGIANLKIFDIMGKEITVLVNEKKAAGEHQVNFNAEQLSSGVYLYKFSSENFVEVKKMIFLK